jgi:predicted chitinase
MDAATLRAAMPGLSVERAAQLLDGANDCLRRCQCTTVDRAAMLLAQVGEESVSLTAPTEFASGAEYEGRKDLGNTEPGDGMRFKGRGFIQVTGRANYGALSAWAHERGICPSPTHFQDNPTDLATDDYVWLGVIWYWTVARPMNSHADARDVERATLAVNGALHGIEDRTSRWHHCLALGEAILPDEERDEFDMADLKDLDAIVRKYTDALHHDLQVILHGGVPDPNTGKVEITHPKNLDSIFAELDAIKRKLH